MKRYHDLFRRLRFGAFLALVWLMGVCPVWAQDDAPAPSGKSYILAYALVLLAIALGLIVICRPGRRTDEVKATEE